MARCGCGTARCTCLVTAGPGVTVDGDGGTANPYVISATGGSSTVSVQDSPSVDLEGDGSAGAPITATVVPDPVADNLLTVGPAGVAVTCEAVQDCVGAALGDGLAYDDAGNQISARLSTETDNTAAFGPDGGIYVPPSGGTGLAVTDSPTVDLTLSGDGSAGSPYNVQADVLLDPAPPGGGTNLIQTGPDGLFVECEQVRGCMSAGPGATYDPATGVIGAAISTDPGNQVTLGSDDGIFVAGGGTGGTSLTVTDTPSIDMTLAGDGSAGNPYEVSADVIIDPAPPAGGANLLHEGANGLYVECADVRSCISGGDGIDVDPATGEISVEVSAQAGNQVTVNPDGLFVAPSAGGVTALQVTDTPSVDLTLSGSGAAGDPYDVTAAVRLDAAPPGGGSNLIHEGPDGLYVECGDVRSCLVEGDGIDYDPATGTISARPSAEPGNTLTIGGDGGLMVPPGGGGATALEVTDSPSIDLTLTGTGAAGDPYDVTATVLLSTDADNRAVFGSDGALYVPPADPLSTDCGLTGDGTPGSPLAAAVQPWPYPCDADAEAGGVYCDSAGNLRSEPRGRYQYFTGTLNENFPNLPVPTTGPPGTLVTTRELEITNPDPCRPAIAITSVEVDVDFNIPAGGQAAYFLYNDEMYKFENRGSAAVTDVHTQTVKVLGNTTIPPGGAVTVQALINLGQGAGGATYNRIQHFLRAMVFVL